MWTYLLLCCLAAGTVFSSDSSPASSSTISNSSLAASSDHLATGLKSFEAVCQLYSKQFYGKFAGGIFPLDSSDTIMVQASCLGCGVYHKKQVLILVSDGAVTETSKDLMVILGTNYVFQIIDPGRDINGKLLPYTIKQNNKKVDLPSMEGKRAVTLRDSNNEVLVDLKLNDIRYSSSVTAQFPQHNITVRYSGGGVVIVHLDVFTYGREKSLGGFCGPL